ncbi:hypothetical protein Tco_1555533 [Tanacetum coccineum]
MRIKRMASDVHQDELCPPNKCYALMDAIKKIDLDNPLCPNESKILANILKNHLLRFNIVASSSVPWIYLGTIFQLPQATDNNHECFVAAPKFLEGSILYKRWKNKAGVGIMIPSWMITDEMKLTEKYRMYAIAFGVDIPTTQSQPTESTQGTHRTTSALRSPNPDVDEGESSAPQKSTVIRLRIPLRRLTRLTPPTPIPTIAKADDIILQDTMQLSLAKKKKRTELEPRSNKESPEVEITVEVQPINTIEEEEESEEDDYELRRREKGKNVEETRHTPSPTTMRSPSIHSTLISSDTEKLQELTADVAKMIADAIKQERENLRAKISSQINNAITNHIPSQDDPHDDAHPEGEKSAKRKKTSEHGTYVFGESSSGQANESKPGPSTSGNQEQFHDFDFWTDSYAINYDEVPTEKVSQELVEEMSQTVEEAKLGKVVDEMLRQ